MFKICKCCGKPKRPKLKDVIEKADLLVSSPPFTKILAMTNDSTTPDGRTRMYRTFIRDIIPNPNEIASFLKQARCNSHLSCKEVCEKGHFYDVVNHGGSCSNWENGLSLPDPEQWITLKDILNFNDEFDSVMMNGKWVEHEYSGPFNAYHDTTKLLIGNGYGHTPGNLANMKEGDIDLVVGSPPYAENPEAVPLSPKRIRNTSDPKKHGGPGPQYQSGQSPGQLGSMKEGSFDLITSSPPYEGSRIESDLQRRVANPNIPFSDDTGKRDYGDTRGNLGGTSGDTFWAASKEIVSQCFELLKPNGKTIWVTKDYIKAKKRIPFSDRWLALCESVGFKLVCRHQALLVKEHGTQITTNGEDEIIQTERKSFFRRLAESKGSPRIDWEDVICMVKS